ncbi:Uncharacterized conserved protein YlxW, UPF0749 family [Peptoclostridium litorale DSM 5388]|uniref:Putative membrane protein n=1 Tax=Peptoclostridium litorale DSM 5388 TaxID=1121324 RepID=A0A069RHT7_PEPLI|nr:DUF881 domain-containing protein [Peptoclostridium litorale]KDR93837.1 putative membrane protein [Peptoclostridium litorale DSM 5388]SIN86835.1 Uncharacterized conserved protein YlxW, UPF0749 family [Peptoclostridium litorale DSM 5388]
MAKKAVKKFDFMFLIIFLFGITIGIQFKAGYSERYELSFMDREIVTQINQMQQGNSEISRQLKYAKKKINAFENSSKESEETKQVREQVEELKLTLGYSQVSGAGVIVKIDIREDVNLGPLMEEKKWFLSILNDIKYYGGETVSINGQRIGPYSAVVLAGNHINVNSIPIVQPYEISIVGDRKSLLKYFNETSIMIDEMKGRYGMDVDVRAYENITVPKLDVEKKPKYVRR